MSENVEYMDRVTDYMEYIMGGPEECNILVSGWKEETVAHQMCKIAFAARPHYRMAALGIIGAMLTATKERTKQ